MLKLFTFSISILFTFFAMGQAESEGLKGNQKELLQAATTKDHYFKLLISSSMEGTDESVSGVKVFEKKTKRLIQQIDLACDLIGDNSIVVGDYNFDGIEDFSVFEASYAGPNTTRIYLVRIPGSEKYFVSEIAGVSLEFDPATKTIFEIKVIINDDHIF